MFDFRYHVASLAAVFLALVIGILVGAGLSGRGLLDERERDNLNRRIGDLQAQLEEANLRIRELEASGQLAEAAYRPLVAGRLADKRVAVLFVGSVDSGVRSAVEETVADAGGRVVRLRAIALPLPAEPVDAALRREELDEYAGADQADDLGRALGAELVNGGETPVWDALAETLVEERGAEGADPAHAVVLCRTARPQTGESARFLDGVYDGVGGAADAAIGVETSTAEVSAIRAYRRSGLSSVDDVDLRVGRVALAVLLAGGRPGHYGIKDTSDEAVPPIEPVVPTPAP